MTEDPSAPDQWMSSSDAIIWEIESDPVLRSPITVVVWLDAAPTDARVEAMIDRLMANVPRLRQRVVSAPARLSTPRWETDPHFDRGFHVRRLRLSSGHATHRDVLDHAQRMAARAFDRDRPPWELEVIDELDDAPAACVIRLHHAIADGLGLVSVMQHMVDFEREPTESRDSETGNDETETDIETHIEDDTTAGSRSSVERFAAAAAHRADTDRRDTQRVVTTSARTASEFVRRPLDTVRRLAATSMSIAKVIAPATTPLSPLMTERSTLLHMDAVTADLAVMKAAANRHGCTVNDAFVSIVADALVRYHQRHDEPAEAIRMHMPVSIRSSEAPGKLDNQFTPTRFVLPLGEVDPIERLQRTRTLLQEVREQPALVHTADITATVRRLGDTASTSLIGAMMRGVDVTTSNVPGSPVPVYLAGARVTEFHGFGPLAGSAINLTFFSYDGRAEIAISTDVAAVPDPEAFTADLESAIADFADLAD